MSDVIKVISVLLVIIILVKRRWNLGAVMALSSVLLALLYVQSPADYLRTAGRAVTDRTTVTLIIALTFIRVFENVMRTGGIMQQMMDAFRGLVMDRRVLMASMPALIGLLPSMGGALFSAPMVEEASAGINTTPEKKAFVNYVFRHPWEFVLPLYPGLILASAITAYPLRDLIVANIPSALFFAAGGVFWGLAGMGAHREGFRSLSGKGFLSFLPLALILVMVIVFHLDLSLSIGAVTLGLYAALGYSPKKIFQSLREGFSWEIVVIILGIMLFKSVLVASGAVANISAFLSSEGIPLMPVLFILPFFSGILTGLTVGFVGSTFPIIWGIESAHSLSAVAFAFASGYVGVLLSPVHLCLVLTREYFRASMPEIYGMTLRTGLLIMIAAALQYLVLNNY